MTILPTPSPRGRGAGLSPLLASFLLAIFCGLTWAGGGTGGAGGASGSSSDPSTNASSPGEEVTSLPVVDATSGVTLVGSLRELRGVVSSVRGIGRVVVTPLARREFAVTFVGDYRIGLDRGVLASTGLRVLFRGGAPFQGGVALLDVGGTSTRLDPDRVPLPVARLAATPRAQGTLIRLDAQGLRAQQTRIAVDFGRSEVTILQRSTL